MNDINKEIIIAKIAEISETDATSINESTVLSDLYNWDSIAVVLLVAFALNEFEIRLNGDEIIKAKTVSDIIEILESNMP